MSIFQKIMAFFGAQYVMLIDEKYVGSEVNIRRVEIVGGIPYARRFRMLPQTMCRLLPGGKIEFGPSYVSKWAPITRKTRQLYFSDNYAEAVEALDRIEEELP